MCSKDEVDSIATEIMSYLQRRPMASDSVDGIMHWWLLQQTIIRNRDLVERALEQLATAGSVSKSENRNRETVYSLAAAPDHRRDPED